VELYSNDYILLLLLFSAAIFDLTRRKIPNFITLPAIGWGLITSALAGGLKGFFFSAGGLLLGLGILLIPFALGGIGGGDVKLLGAVGALQGAHFLFRAALAGALCGGALALLYLLAGGQLQRSLYRICSLIMLPAGSFYIPALKACGEAEGKGGGQVTIPYGAAIALGTLAAWSGLLRF
jgi:prepilin peptidase CpaA